MCPPFAYKACACIPSFKKATLHTCRDAFKSYTSTKTENNYFCIYAKPRKMIIRAPHSTCFKGIKRWGPQPLLYDLIFKNTAKLWLFKE